MTQEQTCPRRTHELGPWDRQEGLDTWTTRAGRSGQDTVGPSCSFCGSLHPDRFMELVREGWIVGPTDKTYKAYLSRPLTDEEKAERKARWFDGFTAQEIRRAATVNGQTEEQVRAELEDVYTTQIAPTSSGTKEAKFYFQHLAEDQRRDFVDLVNSRHMQIGYPGHFYQLPFFMQPASCEGGE